MGGWSVSLPIELIRHSSGYGIVDRLLAGGMMNELDDTGRTEPVDHFIYVLINNVEIKKEL